MVLFSVAFFFQLKFYIIIYRSVDETIFDTAIKSFCALQLSMLAIVSVSDILVLSCVIDLSSSSVLHPRIMGLVNVQPITTGFQQINDFSDNSRHILALLIVPTKPIFVSGLLENEQIVFGNMINIVL